MKRFSAAAPALQRSCSEFNGDGRGLLRVVERPEARLGPVVDEFGDGTYPPARMGRPAAIASMMASEDVSAYAACA